MSKPTERLFSEIKEKAKILNKNADTISAEIEAVDARLKASGVGIDVWLDDPVDTSDWLRPAELPHHEKPQTMRNDIYLGYTKIDDWGLALRIDTSTVEAASDGSELTEVCDSEQKLLRESDRASRIIAFPRIKDVLEAISKELSHKTEQLKQSGK